MRPWPGGGFAPAKPVAGGHAEVTLAGKGRGGSNAFLGGALGSKKQQAFVLFTWPGRSTSRTVKGNMTIRLVMEWCVAFNAECERLSNPNVVGLASRSNPQGGDQSVTLIDRDGDETTEDVIKHLIERHNVKSAARYAPAQMQELHRKAAHPQRDADPENWHIHPEGD